MNRRVLAACLLAGACMATIPARSAAPGLEGVPGFDHVAVIVLENENFNSSWGPGSPATYLNGLRSQGVFADHYFGIGHVSLDNYIAMVSGQAWQPLSGSDCAAVSLWICVQPTSIFSHGRNLADQVEGAGLSWKGYNDSMPAPCFHAPYSPLSLRPDPYQGNSQKLPATDYADRHNPFIYFADIIGNSARCKAHVVPYPDLGADLAADALPSFSFITPDTCHDGHDAPCSNGAPGGLTSADLWLRQEVPALLDYMNAHNGLLLITFDENGFSDIKPLGCCKSGPFGLINGFGGRVGLLALGPGLTPGKVVGTSYDHMSFLRTVEDAFGISEHLNLARKAHAMSDLFTP